MFSKLYSAEPTNSHASLPTLSLPPSLLFLHSVLPLSPLCLLPFISPLFLTCFLSYFQLSCLLSSTMFLMHHLLNKTRFCPHEAHDQVGKTDNGQRIVTSINSKLYFLHHYSSWTFSLISVVSRTLMNGPLVLYCLVKEFDTFIFRFKSQSNPGISQSNSVIKSCSFSFKILST